MYERTKLLRKREIVWYDSNRGHRQGHETREGIQVIHYKRGTCLMNRFIDLLMFLKSGIRIIVGHTLIVQIVPTGILLSLKIENHSIRNPRRVSNRSVTKSEGRNKRRKRRKSYYRIQRNIEYVEWNQFSIKAIDHYWYYRYIQSSF